MKNCSCLFSKHCAVRKNSVTFSFNSFHTFHSHMCHELIQNQQKMYPFLKPKLPGDCNITGYLHNEGLFRC